MAYKRQRYIIQPSWRLDCSLVKSGHIVAIGYGCILTVHGRIEAFYRPYRGRIIVVIHVHTVPFSLKTNDQNFKILNTIMWLARNIIILFADYCRNLQHAIDFSNKHQALIWNVIAWNSLSSNFLEKNHWDWNIFIDFRRKFEPLTWPLIWII